VTKKKPPYRLLYAPGAFDPLDDVDSVVDDAPALAALHAAALETANKVANHQLTGKRLGERRVSGDLSGAYRVAFDIAGVRPQRFCIVFLITGENGTNPTVEILRAGPRAEHVIYKAVAAFIDKQKNT